MTQKIKFLRGYIAFECEESAAFKKKDIAFSEFSNYHNFTLVISKE